MTDLTKITTPLALLDGKTRKALKAHGGPYEAWSQNWCKKWYFINGTPSNWNSNTVYRVAPNTKDSINWDHVANEFICMARDDNGKVYAYTNKPNCGDKVWSEPGDIDSCAGVDILASYRVDILASYKRGTCDWKDSLVFRPGHEPKEEQNDD